MIEFRKVIREAVRAAAGDRIVIAASYDLADLPCRECADEGAFSGYIANSAPTSGLDLTNPLIAGWWIDRGAGLWHLREARASTIVLLGSPTHQEIGTALLLEARRKGVRRLLLVGHDGTVLRDIDPRGALIHQIGHGTPSLPAGDLSYERSFDEIFASVGNRLRLPRDSFVPDRVMLIVGDLGPGGAERQASYTAAGLARAGTYDVHVGCNFVDRPPANLFRPMVEDAGAAIHTVAHPPPGYDTPSIRAVRQRLAPYDALGIQNILHAIVQYAAMIRAVRPAIVHTWMDYSNVLAGIAAELVGVPSIVLSGRSVAPDNFPLLFQPYMRPGYHALLARRDVLFLNNSRTGAVDYARWLGLTENQFQVLYNGFDFPAEADAAARDVVRSACGLAADGLVIGSILRFTEEKRPQLFIDMARVLHLRHPYVRFLLFGAGPMLEEIRAYVDACGLAGLVKLPGLTANAWGALAAMDVFVLTSRNEGLPNVLIEAQASGLPVVCTGVGGMEETFLANETGYSIPAATADALADAVSRLICEPTLRHRMASRAFRHAREAFGIDKMLAQTAKAYDDQCTRNAVRVWQELASLHPEKLYA